MTTHKQAAGKTRRGPNGQQARINLRLRQEICNGVYAPGSRLPTRTELQKRYGAAPVTIQNVFDALTAAGFVRSAGQSGTFVADYPPCLANYAIVFPGHFDSLHLEVSFWRVLANLAESGHYAPQRRFTVYTDLNGYTDSPGYVRLAEDIQAQQVAGIIFASNPYPIATTPLFAAIMSRPALPKVAFMGGPGFPGLPAVSTNHEDSLCLVFNYLQNRGVRRLAVLTILLGQGKFDDFPYEANLYAEAGKRGIQLLPRHVQIMHPLVFPRARPLTQLLLHGRPDERPDGMLILDDSLVEHATQGIAEAGLRPPEDLTVVAYGNFPEPPKSAVPVVFFGLDVSAVFDRFLDILDRQRAGKPCQPLTVIPTEFGGLRSPPAPQNVAPAKRPVGKLQETSK